MEYSLTMEEDLVRLKQDNQEGWEVYSAKKSKCKTRKLPAVATRKSARVPSTCSGGGGFTAISGNTQSTSRGFTILNSSEEEDLVNIALSCDITLGENKTETDVTINAMQLEEISRASLAEAAYNFNLTKRLKEDHSLEGENLSLEIVNNSQRLKENGILYGGDEFNGETQSSLKGPQAENLGLNQLGGVLLKQQTDLEQSELDPGGEDMQKKISDLTATNTQLEAGQKRGAKSCRIGNKERGSKLSRELKRISIQ